MREGGRGDGCLDEGGFEGGGKERGRQDGGEERRGGGEAEKARMDERNSAGLSIIIIVHFVDHIKYLIHYQ